MTSATSKKVACVFSASYSKKAVVPALGRGKGFARARPARSVERSEAGGPVSNSRIRIQNTIFLFGSGTGRCSVLLLSGLTLLSILHSCAPRRSEVALDTSAIDPVSLIKLVRESSARVERLYGKGTVAFDSPTFSGTASFELSLKKPDSLRVLFEGPFGIDVGTLFLSKEQYVVYNSFENFVVTGTPTAAAFRSIIPFDLTVDQILDAFSGAFRIPDDPVSIGSYTIDDNRFLLLLGCRDHTCKYWIDNRSLRVTKYAMVSDKGSVVMQAESSSFVEEGTASAPRKIVVWFPGQERQISVHYSSLTLNPPELSFAYSIPPDVRTIIR